MRVGIFTPAYREQCTVWHKYSQIRDVAWALNNDVELYHFHSASCSIVRQRNWAVKHARERDCDWLMMQDADCAGMDGSILERLLSVAQNRRAAVVGVPFISRTREIVTCAPAKPGEIYEGEVGTGAVIMDLRRLEDVPLPWFAENLSDDGTEMLCGEDIHMCRLLKEHGVWIDYTQATVHVAEEGLLLDPAKA